MTLGSLIIFAGVSDFCIILSETFEEDFDQIQLEDQLSMYLQILQGLQKMVMSRLLISFFFNEFFFNKFFFNKSIVPQLFLKLLYKCT